MFIQVVYQVPLVGLCEPCSDYREILVSEIRRRKVGSEHVGCWSAPHNFAKIPISNQHKPMLLFAELLAIRSSYVIQSTVYYNLSLQSSRCNIKRHSLHRTTRIIADSNSIAVSLSAAHILSILAIFQQYRLAAHQFAGAETRAKVLGKRATQQSSDQRGVKQGK